MEHISSSASLSDPTCRVKNILTRYCYLEGFDSPENSYLLKYFPKYYHSLELKPISKNNILSKVKKIKKLKKFTGQFKGNFQTRLFSLLASNRKEIEEMPVVNDTQSENERRPTFWRRLTRRKFRFFLNLQRLELPNSIHWGLTVKENLVKSMKNMRCLKSLKMLITRNNYSWMKWIIERLNKMTGLLGQLENISLRLETEEKHIQELSQNKNVWAHLTGLDFDMKLDPTFSLILEGCNKLRSLEVIFQLSEEQEPAEICLHSLTQLKRLKLVWWSKDDKHPWGRFKLPASLHFLELKPPARYFTQENIDFVRHWADLKELDSVKFDLPTLEDSKQIPLMKQFVTQVLKKATKLRLFSCRCDAAMWKGAGLTYEPFFVEEVVHLYGSLEKFSYCLYHQNSLLTFDLNFFKPFKNLKELKLDGGGVEYQNIHEAVRLLEGSQKEGDGPKMEIAMKFSFSGSQPGWLKSILEQIEAVKNKSHLKIRIGLAYLLPQDARSKLEELCDAIQSVKAIEGLIIWLNFIHSRDWQGLNRKDTEEILMKYPEIKNIRVVFANKFKVKKANGRII